jgi:hypothetical protein
MFEEAFKVFINPPRELQHLPGIAPSLLAVRGKSIGWIYGEFGKISF